MDSAITFTELLLYSEQETARWKEWFRSHPEALEVPFLIARVNTVRGLLAHIFVVEMLFANAVSNHPRLAWQEMQALTEQDLFKVHEDATQMFRQFIASAQENDWNEIRDVGFGGIKASKRKMVTQALLHGVHHRGQLATHLRQQGFGDTWAHDFILTDVIT